MQKLFSHTFSQNIWRILPNSDAQSNEWALELREISEKKVYFALIDLDNSVVRWLSVPESTDWWTSMTAFANDRVYIHHYRYPELPEPTDLSALSAEDGEIQWTLPNCVFVKALDPETIEVAFKTGGGFQYASCVAKTGEILTSRLVNEMEDEVIFKQPVRYKEGDVYFLQLSSFLKTAMNTSIPVCIDYLDCRPYMVFSYYIYEQDKVEQYLSIFSMEKEVVLHERLSEGRDGVGQSTIMLKGSTLVYLNNSSEFKSLKLS